MNLAQAKIEAVRLVLDQPTGPPAPDTQGWLLDAWSAGGIWLALIGVGLAVAVGAWLAYRWSRVDRAEQAFVLLAVLTGVGRRDREAIRALAAQAGERPVAWLLSAGAWTRGRVAAGEPEARHIAALRRRVIGA